MAYPKFEDLKVWQKAKELAATTAQEVSSCENENMRNHLQRVSVSMMNNIAKGYERKGSKEFDKFLYIARGYTGEYKSMLYLAEDLGCINTAQRETLYETCTDVAKMLSGLIKSIYEKKNAKEADTTEDTREAA